MAEFSYWRANISNASSSRVPLPSPSTSISYSSPSESSLDPTLSRVRSHSNLSIVRPGPSSRSFSPLFVPRSAQSPKDNSKQVDTEDSTGAWLGYNRRDETQEADPVHMADTILRKLMSQGLQDPLPPEYNSRILHVLEAFWKQTEQLTQVVHALNKERNMRIQDAEQLERECKSYKSKSELWEAEATRLKRRNTEGSFDNDPGPYSLPRQDPRSYNQRERYRSQFVGRELSFAAAAISSRSTAGAIGESKILRSDQPPFQKWSENSTKSSIARSGHGSAIQKEKEFQEEMHLRRPFNNSTSQSEDVPPNAEVFSQIAEHSSHHRIFSFQFGDDSLEGREISRERPFIKQQQQDIGGMGRNDGNVLTSDLPLASRSESRYQGSAGNRTSGPLSLESNRPPTRDSSSTSVVTIKRLSNRLSASPDRLFAHRKRSSDPTAIAAARAASQQPRDYSNRKEVEGNENVKGKF